MWLGTFRGLVRFNGQRFAPWAPAAMPGLKSANILNLYQDRQGHAWLSTCDGLVLHDRGQWRRWQENDGWGPRTDLARSYAEAPDGTLVVSRFSGRVLRWGAAGTWEELPASPGAGGSMCAFDEAGALHVFRAGFAGVFEDGAWRPLSGDAAVQKSAVGLGQGRDGRALLVCQQAVLHVRGGAITVRSTLGLGTTFSLYFPASTGSTASPAPASARPAETRIGRREHLLYVDDEEALVTVVEQLLTRAGYRVTGCTRPQDAIDRVRAAPGGFFLVITDYSMPEVTGLDFAAEIRRIQPALPIVVSTGYQRPGIAEQARALGVRAVINKADSPEELLPLIAQVLAERPPART
jgi:CheY-like chemotaxis protein